MWEKALIGEAPKKSEVMLLQLSRAPFDILTCNFACDLYWRSPNSELNRSRGGRYSQRVDMEVPLRELL
jgi:hypothetical protein